MILSLLLLSCSTMCAKARLALHYHCAVPFACNSENLAHVHHVRTYTMRITARCHWRCIVSDYICMLTFDARMTWFFQPFWHARHPCLGHLHEFRFADAMAKVKVRLLHCCHLLTAAMAIVRPCYMTSSEYTFDVCTRLSSGTIPAGPLIELLCCPTLDS